MYFLLYECTNSSDKQTAEQKGIYGEGQHPADEETIARSQKADDKQTMIEKTKILDEKVGSKMSKFQSYIYFSKVLILFKTYSHVTWLYVLDMLILK